MNETEAFIDTMKQSRGHYLEIGVWAGGSIKHAIKHIPKQYLCIGVDPLDRDYVIDFFKVRKEKHGEEKHPAEEIYNVSNDDHINRKRMILVPSCSREFYRSTFYNQLKGQIGYLRIDGNHDKEWVESDCKYIEMVKAGGFIAFHDYRRASKYYRDGLIPVVDKIIKQHNLQTLGLFSDALMICKKRG